MKFHDFFYYNKSDRNVILVLLAIAVASLTALFFLGNDEISVGEGYQGTAQATNNKSAGNKPTLYYKTEESLFMLIVGYLIILLPISLLGVWLERKLKYVGYSN